jgi:hypothetical protein
MSTKRAGLRLYLIDPNTDEVLESHAPSDLAKALRSARAEGCQVVIASSESAAEDIAAGAKPGPMFWPGKTHRGHRGPARKRRTSLKNRRRTSRR